MNNYRFSLPLALILLLCGAAQADAAPLPGEEGATAEGAADTTETTSETQPELGLDEDAAEAAGDAVDAAVDAVEGGMDASGEAIDGAVDTVLQQVLGEDVYDEPTEADVPPARLDEQPSIPDEIVEPIDVLEEDERWVPELTLSAGVYFRENVAPGVLFGVSSRVVEYGPATRRTEGRGSYRQRRVFARIDAEFGINPDGDGLDEMSLQLGAFARRRETEAADGTERGRTDATILPVRIRRSLELDRRIAVSASVMAVDAWREVQVRDRVVLGVSLRVEAVGFSHISYALAPELHFNGLHLAGFGFDVVPIFTPGTNGVRIRYIIGGSADLALGARDGEDVGPRFTTVGDLEAHTGFGFDFGPHVSWDNRAAFLGSVDSQRSNPTGWRVMSVITGRY